MTVSGLHRNAVRHRSCCCPASDVTRIREAIEVRVSDIDLDAAVINIQRRACHTKNDDRDIDLPKSRKSRHVAIPKTLVDDLRKHIEDRGADDDAYVLTRCSEWTAGEHAIHTTANLRNQLYRIAARSDLAGVSPHDLRATGATIAAHHGVPHTLIQAQLGHSRIQTTERYIMVPDVGVLGAYAAVFE